MWTKFDDRFMDRADVSSVSRNARLLLVEAYIYCNRNETDGVFTPTDLRKMTDLKRTGPAIKELIAAGLLEELKTQNGAESVRWRVDWSDQNARLDNELRRASDTSRQHSKRIRDALHKADIHTRCGHQMYCKAADYVGLSQRDPQEASRLESLLVSRHPDQTRPDPTRPGPKGKGEGKGKGGPGNSAGAPLPGRPQGEENRPRPRRFQGVDVTPEMVGGRDPHAMGAIELENALGDWFIPDEADGADPADVDTSADSLAGLIPAGGAAR